jgi:hypothetical protein
MDFSRFVPPKMIPSLHWLGRRDWVEYGDIPDRRQVWGRPKELVIADKPVEKTFSAIGQLDDPKQPWLNRPGKLYVTPQEYNSRPVEFWNETRRILQWLAHNPISTFFMYGMSRSLADGAKIFKATTQQCLDLASDEGEMTCDWPFEDHNQPYPVFILELPYEYQQRLKTIFKTETVPSHVFCQHEKDRMITVSAFFNRDNVVTHLTPNRAEYATLEDSIVSNRRRRSNSSDIADPSIHQENDFDVAELTQRLAINFGMWMSFIGTHVKGPLEPEEYARLKHEASLTSHKKQRRAQSARDQLLGSLQQIVFDQVVEFHDEIIEVDPRPDAAGGTHRSPKPHRRRAHWRKQVCGPNNSERKWIPIKSVIVRKSAFVGDISQMTTTYVTKK